jgi:signal transduction histidine kinase/CheY-like chemotaxis protein
MSLPILSVTIRHEHDVVAARQRARQLAGVLGFDGQDQTRIATAVSEIGRNAYAYAGGGKVEFHVEGQTSPQVFLARISDRGPGIRDLGRILDGRYQSPTGMGLGIVGARRLMDQFQIESLPGRGTTVWLRKLFPRSAPVLTARSVADLADRLARHEPRTAVEEVQQQNQELLRALDELRARQDELTRLNRELEDTNRGVVALYAELDEKADHLRRADELKSRFLSNMTHEFRTPVNSILALSRLLLDRLDGELSEEQARQVAFIRKAAEDLSELVNDLLDLAKVEAGKIVVRPVEFEVANLFGALRGMLRPLLLNESVGLVFEEPEGLPTLYTDDGKVSQILRNFVSNALKFTERGEVRVSAALAAGGQAIVFSVADTGIGIAPEDQERIFEEFTQVDSPVQKRVRGTGLGLPLSKRLAQLLGGEISVRSAPGRGSTFSATIPFVYAPPAHVPAAQVEVDWRPDPSRLPVLVVEDSFETLLLYEKYLKGTRFQVVPARTLREGQQALAQIRPRAVVLDVLLRGEDSWRFLAELKSAAATRDIPVLVATTVEDQGKSLALGADAYCTKPVERRWLIDTLTELTREARAKKILVVDDDEAWRYVIRQLVADAGRVVLEAGNGLEGLARARSEAPDLVVLDLAMPGMPGDEVLTALRSDPATRDIPVLVVTSKALDAAERERLAAQALAVLSKDEMAADTASESIRRVLVDAGWSERP